MKARSCFFRFIIPLIVISGIFFLFFRLFPPKIGFENQADGFAYYLPLRSFYFDGDFYFNNENWSYELFYKRLPYDWKHLTETGHNVYPYSLGPSVLWYPVLRIFSPEYRLKIISPLEPEQVRKWPLFGYSEASLRVLAWTGRFFGFLALIFTYLFCKQVLNKESLLVWAVVFFVFFGSSFYYYFLYQPLMAHVFSAFGVSFFLLWWSRRIGDKKSWDWFLVGLGLGLATLVRWQNFIFLIFPLAEWVFSFKRSRFDLNQYLLSSLMVAGGFLFAFSPQIFFWKRVYGSFLVFPQGKGFFSLDLVNLFKFLFSWRHGFLTWAPVVVFALMGLFWGLWEVRREKVGLKRNILLWASVLVLTVSICLNSFNIDWHGSDAFGARRMVGLTPVFVLGLVLFLERIKKWSWLFLLLLVVLVAYNVIFAYQFSRWMFDHFAKVYPWQVLGNCLGL